MALWTRSMLHADMHRLLRVPSSGFPPHGAAVCAMTPAPMVLRDRNGCLDPDRQLCRDVEKKTHASDVCCHRQLCGVCHPLNRLKTASRERPKACQRPAFGQPLLYACSKGRTYMSECLPLPAFTGQGAHRQHTSGGRPCVIRQPVASLRSRHIVTLSRPRWPLILFIFLSLKTVSSRHRRQ